MFNSALHIVHRRYPQEQIKARPHSHVLGDLQSCRVQQRQEIILVHNIPEVHCGDPLDERFYPLQEGIFILVDGQNEADPAVLVLLEDLLGQFEGLGLVGHEHEGETEEDEPELFLDVALDLVEVHIVDLYLRVVLE